MKLQFYFDGQLENEIELEDMPTLEQCQKINVWCANMDIDDLYDLLETGEFLANSWNKGILRLIK